MSNEISNKPDFSFEVENLKSKSGGDLSYIECVIEICERFELEVETVKSLLSKPIKEKIKFEAMSLNLLKDKDNSLV